MKTKYSAMLSVLIVLMAMGMSLVTAGAHSSITNPGLKPAVPIDINNPPKDIGFGIVGIDNPINVPLSVTVSGGVSDVNNQLRNAVGDYPSTDYDTAKNVKYFSMDQNMGVSSIEFMDETNMPDSVKVDYPEIGTYRNQTVGARMTFSDFKYEKSAWTFKPAMLQVSHHFRSGFAYWNLDSMVVQYDFYYADTQQPLVFANEDKGTLNFESLNVGEYVAPLDVNNDNYVSDDSYVQSMPVASRPGLTAFTGTSDAFDDQRSSSDMHKASVANVISGSNRYVIGATNNNRSAVWNYNELVPFFSPGTATINKVDSGTGAKLPGAVFTVQDETGTTVLKNVTTDATGAALIESLKYGKYTITEVQSPTGYVLNKTPIPFEIDDGVSNNVTLTVKNDKVQDKKVPKDPTDPVEPNQPKEPVEPDTPNETVPPVTPQNPIEPKDPKVPSDVKKPIDNKNIAVTESSVEVKSVESKADKTTKTDDLPATGYDGAIYLTVVGLLVFLIALLGINLVKNRY